MFGYQAAKGVENLARNAGMSENDAKAAGYLTAAGTVIIASDPGGLAYMAEYTIREGIREHSEKSNRQKS